jgi:hypothetical protein
MKCFSFTEAVARIVDKLQCVLNTLRWSTQSQIFSRLFLTIFSILLILLSIYFMQLCCRSVIRTTHSRSSTIINHPLLTFIKLSRNNKHFPCDYVRIDPCTLWDIPLVLYNDPSSLNVYLVLCGVWDIFIEYEPKFNPRLKSILYSHSTKFKRN